MLLKPVQADRSFSSSNGVVTLKETEYVQELQRLIMWNYFFNSVFHTIWDGSVGIATGYGLDGRGVVVRVPVGARNFFISSTIKWVPGVKRPGREADTCN
jgi:hypothetical protein